MVCPFGGFPTIRHNEVRDLTASLLTKVSHNVAIEPSLQPVTTETFSLASANTTNDARLDITTRGFWSRGQDANFDVRVFYPNSSSYRSLNLKSVYKHHKGAKKCKCGHQVRDIEHRVFTPLVFSSTEGMGCEAKPWPHSDLVVTNLFMYSLPGMILLYWAMPFYTESIFA